MSRPPARRPALGPVRRHEVHRQVSERIGALIADGVLRPGDRLPAERELAARLGVSRQTLRRALATLAEEGLVDIRHGSGAYVADGADGAGALDHLGRVLAQQNHDLPAAMEARRALEVEAAALAAERRTGDDLARARRALEAMAAAASGGDGTDADPGAVRSDEAAVGDVERPDVGAVEEADAAFHRALWDAARSPALRALLDHLGEDVARLRRESLAQPGRPPRSVRAHEQILAAVEAGDAPAARSAMRAHLSEVGDVVLVHPRPGEPRPDEP